MLRNVRLTEELGRASRTSARRRSGSWRRRTGTSPARAQHPRRRPAAARGARREDPSRSRPDRARSGEGSRDADPGRVRDPGGARGPPRPRPGHLPAAAGGQGPGSRTRRAGPEVPVPVEVAADGVDRFPQEVEAAVYFSALEALQNTAKYADASRATVTLSRANGSSSSPSPTTVVGSTPARPATVRACKVSRTASAHSTANSRSRAVQDRARRCGAACRSTRRSASSRKGPPHDRSDNRSAAGLPPVRAMADRARLRGHGVRAREGRCARCARRAPPSPKRSRR